MVLSPVAMLQKYLGIREVVNEISKKEKFWRNRYIGVLRCESIRVRVMMLKFPDILTV